MERVAGKFCLLRVEAGVAVLEMGNRVQDWMGSCLALVLIRETGARGRRARVVPRAIVERLHYAPFRRDRGRGGRAARGRSSAVAAAAASLAVEVAGPHQVLPEAAVVEVLLRTRPYVEM